MKRAGVVIDDEGGRNRVGEVEDGRNRVLMIGGEDLEEVTSKLTIINNRTGQESAKVVVGFSGGSSLLLGGLVLLLLLNSCSSSRERGSGVVLGE